MVHHQPALTQVVREAHHRLGELPEVAGHQEHVAHRVEVGAVEPAGDDDHVWSERLQRWDHDLVDGGCVGATT